jgi:hypothetical protein
LPPVQQNHNANQFAPLPSSPYQYPVNQQQPVMPMIPIAPYNFEAEFAVGSARKWGCVVFIFSLIILVFHLL